jgi:hypothetical protein
MKVHRGIVFISEIDPELARKRPKTRVQAAQQEPSSARDELLAASKPATPWAARSDSPVGGVRLSGGEAGQAG